MTWFLFVCLFVFACGSASVVAFTSFSVRLWGLHFDWLCSYKISSLCCTKRIKCYCYITFTRSWVAQTKWGRQQRHPCMWPTSCNNPHQPHPPCYYKDLAELPHTNIKLPGMASLTVLTLSMSSPLDTRSVASIKSALSSVNAFMDSILYRLQVIIIAHFLVLTANIMTTKSHSWHGTGNFKTKLMDYSRLFWF